MLLNCAYGRKRNSLDNHPERLTTTPEVEYIASVDPAQLAPRPHLNAREIRTCSHPQCPKKEENKIIFFCKSLAFYVLCHRREFTSNRLRSLKTQTPVSSLCQYTPCYRARVGGIILQKERILQWLTWPMENWCAQMLVEEAKLTVLKTRTTQGGQIMNA